jgi:hypothetical protein
MYNLGEISAGTCQRVENSTTLSQIRGHFKEIMGWIASQAECRFASNELYVRDEKSEALR